MARWQGHAESTGDSSANLAVVPESKVDSAGSATAPSTNHASRRILIATWGSLGDLHPYVALALGLQSRGHEAVLATGECFRRKIEALGIGFRPVRPDCAWVADPVFMRRLAHPRWGMLRAVQVPLVSLRESYEDTLAAAEGSDLLVANLAAYATGIVAEKKGIPWVSAMHSPTLFFSAYDPPLIPGFPGLSIRLRSLGPNVYGPLGRSINWAARGLARPWHRLRKDIGLAPARGFNPLTESYSPVLHLALFSKWLADKQRDWPAQTVVTGFPWFDAEAGAALPQKLARFLDDGEPPLVFTLGSAVVADAGPFYHESAAVAKLLGRRAVLLAKNPRVLPPELPEGVVAFDYAPFSLLFPRAAAIVHHGGIGTTGEAMRSGRPSLVMPCAWDQPDNADRAARHGIARTIARNRYARERVATELRLLLEDPAYSQRAAEIARKVRQEEGVKTACDAIESLFQVANPLAKQ
jgi:UDP:flavonoid glycosyltransferase YjiC (YdhE family)